MGKKILIVDDSPTILMSMRGMLERAGHAVSNAASGEEAVSVLKGGLKPDLVITDYHMGAMNGIELVREVRKMSNLRFIPVLMVTTNLSRKRLGPKRQEPPDGWSSRFSRMLCCGDQTGRARRMIATQT
jgi:two-component system chemotaxis response regulator CheY